VCILDLDLQFGDVLTCLNVPPDYSLAEALADGQRMELPDICDHLPRHDSGLRVLSQTGMIEGLSAIDTKGLTAFVKALSGHFDHVLVDGVRDFNDFALALLDLADDVVLVATQDVPTVRGLALRLDVFEQLGYQAEELAIVVNRHGRRSPISLRALRDSLDVEPAFVVANDFARVHKAMNAGAPLGDFSPDARVTRDIAKMAEVLFDIDLSLARPRSGFGRLFAR
jgi:pilus assembly protein CpaE